MPRPSTVIRIAQPCAESWAAMTPTAAGRHCAACQKVVVDFMAKTDAEILAYFRQSSGKQACGRFWAGQLARPLAPSDAATTGRWRAWLAALAAVWSLRLVARQEAQGQPIILPIAASAASGPAIAAVAAPSAAVQITGVVLDSATHEKMPGVTIALQGTTLVTSSDASGQFSLTVLPEAWQKSQQVLVLSSVGYRRQAIPVASASPAPLEVLLAADNQALGETIVVGGYTTTRKPWPWHPRRLYYWGKYWLTRPFR
ncbi:MAG: carboxypeptidase-like regulatory domain-containing protein [Janthinobacterium lividum]